MPTIVSRVKVREIVVHLPCLTAHDRETIEAKRETCGNYDAMRLLLDCLKRRENWPEQFIQALEACEHMVIAAEIREEYNVLRGIRDPAHGSPSQTVVTAHVHPAPPAACASVQDTTEVPVVVPVAAGPPEPSTADPPEVSQSPAVEPPQPVAGEPPAPRTPSPSPETPPPRAAASPPPQIEADAHQEPEENSELETEEVCGNGDSRATDTPPLDSTSLTNSDVTDGSFFTLTPEKLPVQDSNPPDAKVAPSSTQMETTPAVDTVNAIDDVDGGLALCDDASLFLSKPGELLSVQPFNHGGSTIHVPNSPLVAPYSGDSCRLEMSKSRADALSARPCQENGDTLNHSEPEENHYESPCGSVVVNEGHIAEEPSMQNLEGQSSPWPAQNANGDAGKAVESAPLSSAAAVTAPKQDPKLKRSLSTKAAYISMAAGVATCAVLVGWRFMK